MSHKMLRPFIVKLSVLCYFHLCVYILVTGMYVYNIYIIYTYYIYVYRSYSYYNTLIKEENIKSLMCNIVIVNILRKYLP